MIIIILSFATDSSAKNLGIVGKTFPFAEKDALTEIEDRAKQVDWKRNMVGLKENLQKFRPELIELPRVVANRIRIVDPTYTLEVDVPDPRDPSRVLYPKGFTFNPFQYMNLPGCIVFMNPLDKDQQIWLKNSLFLNDVTAKILLTDGDIGKMERTYGRPFFYADNILIDRLSVMAVPSAVCQKGVSIEIQEFLP